MSFVRSKRIVFAIVVAATATACASTPAPSISTSSPTTTPAPSAPSQPGACDASTVQWAIGQMGDQATMGRVWRESGAGLIRPLIEGQAALQDHKPDRVNIHLDQDNRIVSIDCG